MKISQKTCDKMYAAIHNEVMKVRMKLNLPANDDMTLAQLVTSIWLKQKRALGLPLYK